MGNSSGSFLRLHATAFTLHENEVSVDLVTFTEEILNGKLHFLSSVKSWYLCQVRIF